MRTPEPRAPANRGGPDHLLLGEWACLGILYDRPAHGFAVAKRLAPEADVGRVWSLSRALTYRSLEQLTARGFVEPIGEEPGIAGGTRTILRATRAGRASFREWVHTPVEHVRDLRSELLLKLVLADANDLDVTDTIAAQRDRVAAFLRSFDDDEPADVVLMWRQESTAAALRFLERLQA